MSLEGAIPLSPRNAENLCALARKTAIDVVRYARIEHGPINWSQESVDGKITLYKGVDPSAPPDVWTYCADAEIHGTIDQVAALFHPSAQHEALLQGGSPLHQKTLYTLATPTPEFPHHLMRVLWFVLPAAGHGLVARNRDYCVLECQHDFDVDGKRGWARSLKSIPLGDVCPIQPNYVRADLFRSGVVVMESTRPGFLHISHLIQLNPRGMLHPVFIPLGIKRRCHNLILDVDRLIHLHRCDRPSVPVASSHCIVCLEPFGLWQRKCYCRLCGHAVCGTKCAQEWHAAPMSLEVFVCNSCIVIQPSAPYELTIGIDNSDVYLGHSTSSQIKPVELIGPTANSVRPDLTWDLRLSDGSRLSYHPLPDQYEEDEQTLAKNTLRILVDLGVDQYGVQR